MGGANDTGGGEIRPSQPGLFQHPQELWLGIILPPSAQMDLLRLKF